MNLLSSVWRDLCLAGRTLAKSRGFLAVAVLCLALGIGANSTMFSLVDGYWMRPLPVRDPGGLVYLFTNTPKGTDQLSYAEYLDYRNQSKSFTGLAATQRRSPVLTGQGYAESTMSNVVSENYFTLLGVGAHVGRVFTEADAAPGHRVVVMSYNMWQRRFGGDPGIVGKPIRLNGAYEVVGIAPKGFRGTELWQDSDFWIPIDSWDRSGEERRSRESRSFEVMGRLKRGVAIASVRSEVSALAAELEQAYPRTNRGCHAFLQTAGEYFQRRTDYLPYLLLGIVGLVLLIACANLANLLIARGTSRAREIGVRLALGSTRGRLVRQLMAESVLICALGTAAGLMLASWLIRLLPTVIIPAANSYSHMEFRMDGRVLAFTLLTSLLTVLIFGLAPALRASRQDVMGIIKGETSAAGLTRIAPRSVLVVLQVAVSLVLLTAAGLLVRTFIYSLNLDLGFQRRDLLIAEVDTPESGQKAQDFYRQLATRIDALPGVSETTLALRAPLSGSGGGRAQAVTIADKPLAPGESAPRVMYTSVDWNYFRVMGIRLMRGRVFDSHDTAGSPQVIVINETMARAFWPGEDPIGKVVRLANEKDRERTVAGVVTDSKVTSMTADTPAYFYLPFQQTSFDGLVVIAATKADPLRLANPLRAEVAAADRRAVVLETTTMRLLIKSRLYEQQAMATIVGGLGAIGLSLAAVGLYGLIAHAVTRRTREIGIRMALGAPRSSAIALVLRQSLSLTMVGIAIGLAGAFYAARLLKNLVYGISVYDPLTYTIVVASMLLVALAASLIPARRATRIEPTSALRYE
jgi:predicted permease